MFKSPKDFKVLISRDQIKQRVSELGVMISQDYQDQKEPLLLVGVLKGSFMFLADLIREIKVPCEVDFVEASSYGSGTVSSGNVEIRRDLDRSMKGREVILVEDIVDTGYTVSSLKREFESRSPRSFKLCSLLYKPARAKIVTTIDYLGFEIEDHFVVGYGLDVNSRYRELKDLVIYPES